MRNAAEKPLLLNEKYATPLSPIPQSKRRREERDDGRELLRRLHGQQMAFVRKEMHRRRLVVGDNVRFDEVDRIDAIKCSRHDDDRNVDVLHLLAEIFAGTDIDSARSASEIS